jgi:hypothetical protein
VAEVLVKRAAGLRGERQQEQAEARGDSHPGQDIAALTMGCGAAILI